jgi:hypothetical protein
MYGKVGTSLLMYCVIATSPPSAVIYSIVVMLIAYYRVKCTN